MNETKPIHPHPKSCEILGHGLLGNEVKKNKKLVREKFFSH